MVKRAGWLLTLVVPLLAAGCGKRIPRPPSVDAPAATAQIMKEYDTNGDGYLDADELQRCPSLKRALLVFDKDRDGKLSKAEIEQGLAGFRTSGIGLAVVLCKVTLDEQGDRQPLVGASVVFEPERFLGPNIKPARGTTDTRGRAQMQMEGAKIPGCQIGLYRVRISKMEAGKETIPPCYNTQTILGTAVLPGDRESSYKFDLTRP
jgi:hypothetical protein